MSEELGSQKKNENQVTVKKLDLVNLPRWNNSCHFQRAKP